MRKCFWASFFVPILVLLFSVFCYASEPFFYFSEPNIDNPMSKRIEIFASRAIYSRLATGYSFTILGLSSLAVNKTPYVSTSYLGGGIVTGLGLYTFFHRTPEEKEWEKLRQIYDLHEREKAAWLSFETIAIKKGKQRKVNALILAGAGIIVLAQEKTELLTVVNYVIAIFKEFTTPSYIEVYYKDFKAYLESQAN